MCTGRSAGQGLCVWMEQLVGCMHAAARGGGWTGISQSSRTDGTTTGTESCSNASRWLRACLVSERPNLLQEGTDSDTEPALCFLRRSSLDRSHAAQGAHCRACRTGTTRAAPRAAASEARIRSALRSLTLGRRGDVDSSPARSATLHSTERIVHITSKCGPLASAAGSGL